MKIFIVVLSLFVIYAKCEFVLPTEEDVQKAREDCGKEFNISDEQMANFKKHEYPDEDNIHSFIRCVCKKLEFWNDEAGFVEENILKAMKLSDEEKDEFHTKINKCLDKNEQGSSKNAWAYRNYMCLVKENVIQRGKTRTA